MSAELSGTRQQSEDDDEERDPAGERVQLYRRQSLKKHMEPLHVQHYLEDRDSLELLRLLFFFVYILNHN